ncbi:hypothetical protein [Streptomyces vietnamensis]|uniref:hypothetical protein n=1 Tax=Streptomyces vietnamensis TaxID=362257 RepID=UPI00343CB1B8
MQRIRTGRRPRQTRRPHPLDPRTPSGRPLPYRAKSGGFAAIERQAAQAETPSRHLRKNGAIMPRKTRRRLARGSEPSPRGGRWAATDELPPQWPGTVPRSAATNGRPRRPVHTIQVPAAFL